MNIFQIQQELLDIFEELEETGGELTEELEQQLAITQENFKTKIESYANVIKSVKADIAAIDEETKRLAALKKSKQGMIDRLSNIMANSIDMFGETTKSGGKFIDYGTGKISVRNTVKCEVDEAKVKCMGDEFARQLAYEVMLGNASNRENITFEELIQRCKEHVCAEDDGTIVEDGFDVTRGDIEHSAFDITIRAGLEDMCCDEGFRAIKNLSETFGKSISLSPKIDKTWLKGELPNSDDVTIGKLVENKSITIK